MLPKFGNSSISMSNSSNSISRNSIKIVNNNTLLVLYSINNAQYKKIDNYVSCFIFHFSIVP